MTLRARRTIALVSIVVVTCTCRAFARTAPRHGPFEVRPTATLNVQAGHVQSREIAPFRPLTLPLPASPLTPRKPETAPSTLPQFTNPLRRRRLAMPIVPSGDYAF